MSSAGSSSASAGREEAGGPGPAVLAVDLDGTLLATDALWEAVLVLVRTRPGAALLLPVWLARGKANLKRQVGLRVALDPAALPYRAALLDYLRAERDAGRSIVLATAADAEVAARIARHLGVFSDVLASDGRTNLAGPRKRDALVSRYGRVGFDYVGNGRVDMPLWRCARSAIVVSSSPALLEEVRRVAEVSRVFEARSGGAAALATALRPHHWLKNLLVPAALAFAPAAAIPDLIGRSAAAFASFCLCASGTYLLNDLLDLDEDRADPRTSGRPLASGAVPILTAVLAAAALLVGGFALGLAALPPAFAACLGAYVALTTAYSWGLKRVGAVDVLALAGLYTLRIVAGAVALAVAPSPWILTFALFLFLSMAFARRYADARAAPEAGPVPGRSYGRGDRAWLAGMGAASGYVSVLVLALVLADGEMAALVRRPWALWLACPLLLYWISRVWLRAHRGTIAADPVLDTVRDPVSYAVGAAGVLLLALAA